MTRAEISQRAAMRREIVAKGKTIASLRRTIKDLEDENDQLGDDYSDMQAENDKCNDAIEQIRGIIGEF